VIGTKEKPEYKLDSPVIKFTIETKDKKVIEYKISDLDDENYVIKVSNQPWYLKAGKTSLDFLKEITRERMLKPNK